MNLDKSGYSPAQFKKRLMAFFVDYAFVAFIEVMLFFSSIIIFEFVNGMNPLDYQSSKITDEISHSFQLMHNILLAYVFPFLISPYYIFLESSSWQATLGKRIFGLQVVDGVGNRISLQKSFLRTMGKVLSGVVPLDGIIQYGAFSVISRFGYLINLIVALATSNKQTIYDKIAMTFVVERWPMKNNDRPIIINAFGRNNKVAVDASSYRDNSIHVKNSFNNNHIETQKIFLEQLSQLKKRVATEPASKYQIESLKILCLIEEESTNTDKSQLIQKIMRFGKDAIDWLYKFAVEVGANLIADLLVIALFPK